MKVCNPVDISNLFHKVNDTSDEIIEGTTKKFDTGVPPANTDALPEGAANKYDTGVPPVDTSELPEGGTNFYAGVSGADFKKAVDTSDEITEGVSKLFYPDTDKAKVSDLPDAPNAYLEIEEATTPPTVGEAGAMYHDKVADKFYRSDGAAWIECLFASVDIV